MTRKVSIKSLADEGLQVRVAIDPKTVKEYRALMLEGTAFPPVTIYEVEGKLVLVDGFHRVAAAKKAKFKEIEAEVIPGTRKDALKAAIKANFRHGLPRTQADKRKALQIAWDNSKELFDGLPSHQLLADACGVSRRTAMRWAKGKMTSDNVTSETRVGKDGRVTNVSAIGTGGAKATAPSDDAGGGSFRTARPDSDPLGRVWPERFRGADKLFKGIVDNLVQARSQHREGIEAEDIRLAHVPSQFTINLDNAIEELRGARPYCVCPNCEGEGCNYCHDVGAMTKAQFNQLPADMRQKVNG